MDASWISTIVWTAFSTFVGAIVAIILNRHAAERSRWLRAAIATATALMPALLVTALVLLSVGHPLSLLLSMSPEEFLLPFAFQLAITLSVALPVSWLISRQKPDERQGRGCLNKPGTCQLPHQHRPSTAFSYIAQVWHPGISASPMRPPTRSLTSSAPPGCARNPSMPPMGNDHKICVLTSCKNNGLDDFVGPNFSRPPPARRKPPISSRARRTRRSAPSLPRRFPPR